MPCSAYHTCLQAGMNTCMALHMALAWCQPSALRFAQTFLAARRMWLAMAVPGIAASAMPMMSVT